MGFSPLANKTTNTFQKSSRNGQRPDFFGVHHAASTSHQGVVKMMTSGSREVSAHYVVSDIIEGVVDENYRAWSLSSSYWDSRMVTVETINNSTNGWTVSDKTFDNLARLIADWAKRYNRPINDNTVLTHQEVYTRFGESYPTACPGDLQRRKPELLALANKYLKNGNQTPQGEEEEEMDTRQLYATPSKRRALFVPGTAYFVPWVEGGSTYANNFAKGLETGSSIQVTDSLFDALRRGAEALLPKERVAVEIVEAE